MKQRTTTIVLTQNQHRQVEEISTTKLQAFQRKIYLKAKQNPTYKFYCLYDKIFRRDTLEEAYKQAKTNRGASGVDGVTFDDLDGKEEEFIDNIQEELKTRTYTPQELRVVEIPKDKGKTRTLKIPTIKDRVVQTAIKIIIEPIFEADFEDCSYGYRPKRGALQAIQSLGKVLFREVYRKPLERKVVQSIDLTDCFNNIPHRGLMKAIGRRVIDRKVLKLIKMMIQAGIQKNEDGKSEKRGTPQGGVISPLLANIYLDKLDKYWKEKTKLSHLVRYADDIVIVLNKAEEKQYQEYLQYLEQELKLEVNQEKTTTESIATGVNYLGFTLREKTSRKQKQCLSVEPSKKSMNRVREKIRAVVKYNRKGSTDEIIGKVNTIVRGWQQYFDNIGMGRTRKQINHYVELRVMKMISKRNKKAKLTWKLFTNNKIYDKYGLYRMENLHRKLN